MVELKNVFVMGWGVYLLSVKDGRVIKDRIKDGVLCFMC